MPTVMDTETATCSKCREAKPFDEFNRNRSRPNGHEGWCRNCHREYKREYRQRPEVRERKRERSREYCAEGRYREWEREHNRERSAAGRAYLHQLKSAPCIDCGGDFPPEKLLFHHRDPATKSANVGAMTMCSRATLDAEIAKCDYPLCKRCHHARHAELNKLLGGAAAPTETPVETGGLESTDERSLIATAPTH